MRLQPIRDVDVEFPPALDRGLVDEWAAPDVVGWLCGAALEKLGCGGQGVIGNEHGVGHMHLPYVTSLGAGGVYTAQKSSQYTSTLGA